MQLPAPHQPSTQCSGSWGARHVPHRMVARRPCRQSLTRIRASSNVRSGHVEALHTPSQCTQASERIAEGKQLYAARDRMGALAQFEAATNQEGSQADIAAAWYNIAVVHASFGDVEPAQQALRTAIMMGLDLEDANADPAALKMTASPQIIIQLKKFAAAVRRQRIEAATAPAAPPPAAPRPPNNTGAEQARTWRSGLDDDLSDILQTENSQGIDASIGAILRRVVLLLLAGVGLGTALFYLGLKYAFPENP